MKHASRSHSHPLRAKVRSLGFNPDYLTAEEQEELVAIDKILTSTSDIAFATSAARDAQQLLV
jgi:hypothetical protein